MNDTRSKTKEEEQPFKPPSQLFQPTIAKISIAQICQSIGFTGSQTSALEAFSTIATRYLETLAKSASLSANSSGRTQCNLLDVISALEDLNSIQGFDGATDVKKSVLKSGILREVMKFVSSIDETPFAKPIPRRGSGKRFAFSQRGGEFGGISHMPHWVPSLPDPSTYKNVDVRVCREEEEKDGEGADWSIDRNIEKSMEKKSFLPVKRQKVKFKFGLDSALGVNVELGMRNGICRGGKRVLWCNVSEEEEIKSFKRRR